MPRRIQCGCDCLDSGRGWDSPAQVPARGADSWERCACLTCCTADGARGRCVRRILTAYRVSRATTLGIPWELVQRMTPYCDECAPVGCFECPQQQHWWDNILHEERWARGGKRKREVSEPEAEPEARGDGPGRD